jgi:diacylglycerol kinase (ATP)
MPESVVVLANPAAGSGRSRRAAAARRGAARKPWAALETIVSRGPGHLAEEAAAAGARGRAAAGRAGRRRHAVRGRARPAERAGRETALGIVPLGTGNDFVKSARAAARLARRLPRLAAGCTPRRIDAGRVNGRWFINGVGLGFDAAIARATLRHKWLPGPLGYAAGLFDALVAGVGCPVCTLRWDGGEDRRAVTLVAACNGQYAGGLFHLAPGAALDDGRLDIVWADALEPLQVLRHAPSVIRGTHERLAVAHRAQRSGSRSTATCRCRRRPTANCSARNSRG